MKKRSIFLIIAVLVIIGSLVLIYIGTRKKPGSIKTAGIIEGTEVNLSPQVPGIISYMCCNEGDHIKQGEVAFKLESRDIKALADQAEAGVRKAKAGIMVSESAVENSRAEMKSAEENIRTTEANTEKTRVQMELAEKEMDRANALYKRNFVSKDSVDVAETQYKASAADFAASQSGLASAYSKRDSALAQLKTTENQLNSSKADLKQAEANLQYNAARLAYTVVTCPITGVVALKALEKGEMVNPGVTVLTVVDMNDLYARLDIDETLINNIKLNGRALISPEGYPKKIFKGWISEIGRYGEFATQTDVTRGRQDIRTFRVKVRFGDTGGVLKPGMTVEVTIPEK